MSDLFDYLRWRADIPFEIDPFNEVDNLVLAELAYTNFKGVLDHGEDLPIEEVCERFFSLHTEEEVTAGDDFTRFSPLLMKEMIIGKRYTGSRLFSYIDVIDTESEEQVSAVSILLPDRTVYVAYRGTDSSIVGWKEDFNLSYMTGTPGQERAAKYLRDNFANLPLPLRVGGHSKGGNFAVYASVNAPENIRNRILNVYSNDGPGFRKDFVEKPAYYEILEKIISIIPESSMIGMIMENEYEHHIVHSSAKGILQHDALSWQILRNHFEEVEKRSDDSIFFDQVLKEWLLGVSDEDRKQFVDSLFSFYEVTGKNTVDEVRKDFMKSMNAMAQNLSSMPKEQKTQFFEILGKLLDSTGKTLRSEWRKQRKLFLQSIKA